MGGWRVAQSPILVTTITIERLQKKGYESMLDYYLKVSSQFNEPLYMRTAWFILSEVEGYSGVRGASRLLTQARPSTRLALSRGAPSLSLALSLVREINEKLIFDLYQSFFRLSEYLLRERPSCHFCLFVQALFPMK